MADMTITWKGAVPFDGLVGQAENVGATAVAMVDPAMVAAKFDIRPLLDTSFESSMKGARQYLSADDADQVDGDLEDLFLAETSVKRGRK